VIYSNYALVNNDLNKK